MQLNDTECEGDGDRSLINWKMLMLYFRCRPRVMKYAYEAMRFITCIKALYSEKTSHRILHGQFVNPRGGEGENYANDLKMEHCIPDNKQSMRAMRGNKTLKAVQRSSSSSYLQKEFDSGIRIFVHCFARNGPTASHNLKKLDFDILKVSSPKSTPLIKLSHHWQVRPGRIHVFLGFLVHYFFHCRLFCMLYTLTKKFKCVRCLDRWRSETLAICSNVYCSSPGSPAKIAMHVAAARLLISVSWFC